MNLEHCYRKECSDTVTALKDLVEEQKCTIHALNMALGGEDSTSTENLIDAHEVDYAEEGLIALCRNLTKENARLEDVVLFQKKAWAADFEELEKLRDQAASTESSPITEEVEDILRSKNHNLFNALMAATWKNDELHRTLKEFRKCIERMRVAGGSHEFQMAFELAKDLLP